MAANEVKNLYLEKLEVDWKKIPQFAQMWNIPCKRNPKSPGANSSTHCRVYNL